MSESPVSIDTHSVLQVKLLNEAATLPTYGTPGSAGLDLYSAESCVIPPRSQAMVNTGIAIQIDRRDFFAKSLYGVYGRIAPRSGLAAKAWINVHAGVIDADYTGPVKVLLMNNSDTPFPVNVGDRIAQYIPTMYLKDLDVVQVDELDVTTRGAGGFGSTGK